jgi:hypothetical protein
VIAGGWIRCQLRVAGEVGLWSGDQVRRSGLGLVVLVRPTAREIFEGYVDLAAARGTVYQLGQEVIWRERTRQRGFEAGAIRPSQNAAVVRDRSTTPGDKDCNNSNPPGMINEPGGPPRRKTPAT